MGFIQRKTKVVVEVGTPQISRLSAIDSLRGLAALYVVLHHAWAEAIDSAPLGKDLPIWLVSSTDFLRHGSFAVSWFIALSGFCLYLPLARTGSPELPGGVRRFIGRRLLRIYPNYLCALLLFALVTCLVPSLHAASGTRWDAAIPFSSLGTWLSHLLLVHNWNSDWIYKIDPPMWSIATEWQIYLLMPFFLLPLLKERGWVALIAGAFTVGLAPVFLQQSGVLENLLLGACPWYLGVFALGMGAAYLSVRSGGWGRIPLLPTALGTLWFARILYLWPVSQWISDTVAVLALLPLLVNSSRSIDFKPLRFLGEISYSLYLYHWLALTLITQIALVVHASPLSLAAMQALIGVPGSIAVAWLFYHWVEKPCLRRLRSEPRGDSAAVATGQSKAA